MGKAITFMVFMWMVVVIGGGVVEGIVPMATTTLTVAIDDDDATITVNDTSGFPDSGIIQILDERIGYASTTATTFRGNFAQPLVRGAQNTEAIAHSTGERVRTIESSMINTSLAYKLAVLSEASGAIAFVTIPFTLIGLLISFLVLPLSFLGTELEILTYIWGALSLGILMSITVGLVGGRRVG